MSPSDWLPGVIAGTAILLNTSATGALWWRQHQHDRGHRATKTEILNQLIDGADSIRNSANSANNGYSASGSYR